MLMLIFSVLGGSIFGWLWTAELPDARIKGASRALDGIQLKEKDILTFSDLLSSVMVG